MVYQHQSGVFCCCSIHFSLYSFGLFNFRFEWNFIHTMWLRGEMTSAISCWKSNVSTPLNRVERKRSLFVFFSWTFRSGVAQQLFDDILLASFCVCLSRGCRYESSMLNFHCMEKPVNRGLNFWTLKVFSPLWTKPCSIPFQRSLFHNSADKHVYLVQQRLKRTFHYHWK